MRSISNLPRPQIKLSFAGQTKSSQPVKFGIRNQGPKKTPQSFFRKTLMATLLSPVLALGLVGCGDKGHQNTHEQKEQGAPSGETDPSAICVNGFAVPVKSEKPANGVCVGGFYIEE
jgi:hypothetical protein